MGLSFSFFPCLNHLPLKILLIYADVPLSLYCRFVLMYICANLSHCCLSFFEILVCFSSPTILFFSTLLPIHWSRQLFLRCIFLVTSQKVLSCLSTCFPLLGWANCDSMNLKHWHGIRPAYIDITIIITVSYCHTIDALVHCFSFNFFYTKTLIKYL